MHALQQWTWEIRDDREGKECGFGQLAAEVMGTLHCQERDIQCEGACFF